GAGKRVPERADRATIDACMIDEEGEVFYCVVRATMDRVTPVIGGNDDEVIFSHLVQYFGKSCIKCLKRFPVSYGVPAMSIFCIEINQVQKAYTVEIGLHRFKHFRHAIIIISRSDRFCNPFTIIDVIYFSKSNDIFAIIFQFIHDGSAKWFTCIIMSVFRTFEMPWLTDKWSGNDTTYLVLVLKGQFPCYFTNVIELVQWYDFFMCRNLQDGIG